MRKIEDITKNEMAAVNEILKDEYNFYSLIKTPQLVLYQCFDKSHACYSGRGVVKVYNYLKSIDIFI